MITLSIFNQKGGVAKTTTAVNVAAELSAKGYKVLLIDSDPQGNATSTLGLRPESLKTSLMDSLVDGNIDNQILKVEFEVTKKFKDRAEIISSNLRLVPASMRLTSAEVKLANVKNNMYLLNDLLVDMKEEFDFVIIDCNPGAGVITLNALVASDYIIVPFETEFYAIDGIKNTDVTFRQVKETFNNELEILGYVATKHKQNQSLNEKSLNLIKDFKAGEIFETIIGMNSELSKAPANSKPINLFNDRCKGYKQYKLLTEEIIKRLENK